MSQVITNIIGGLYQPFAFETITVSSSALGFTSSVYDTAAVKSGASPLYQVQYVVVTSETDSVRYTVDSTTPTSSIGHLMTSGSSLVLVGYSSILNFRAIRVTADATLQVTYYR